MTVTSLTWTPLRGSPVWELSVTPSKLAGWAERRAAESSRRAARRIRSEYSLDRRKNNSAAGDVAHASACCVDTHVDVWRVTYTPEGSRAASRNVDTSV